MKWRDEIEAEKRVSRDAKLNAARAAKFTLEVPITKTGGSQGAAPRSYPSVGDGEVF